MNSLRSEYKTVSGAGTSRLVEKKSEFIGYAAPVTSEQAALDILNARRKQYSDATHNVYAYVVSQNNLQRYSDDGEPSGTSGMPTLSAVQKQNLTDIIVVVTRYFGGTLLGTGGLVHAYGKCAADAISAAKPVICRLCSVYEVVCDYTLSGKIAHLLEGGDYVCENTEYTDAVKYTVCVKQGSDSAFLTEITEITAAKAAVTKCGDKYINIPIADCKT